MFVIRPLRCSRIWLHDLDDVSDYGEGPCSRQCFLNTFKRGLGKREWIKRYHNNVANPSVNVWVTVRVYLLWSLESMCKMETKFEGIIMDRLLGGSHALDCLKSRIHIHRSLAQIGLGVMDRCLLTPAALYGTVCWTYGPRHQNDMEPVHSVATRPILSVMVEIWGTEKKINLVLNVPLKHHLKVLLA
jgi:hypothetical protein